MVNIKTLPDRIIFDGHADTAKECETITLMCDGLACNNNFRTVAYRKGYAEFEKIGVARELKFVGAPALLTMVFDNHITKVTGLGNEWTTSGTEISAALPNSYDGVAFTFSATLQDGYVLDTVSANLDYGSFGHKTDNSFTLIADSSGLFGTITITSKQSTPKVSIDVTTLSGYESLAAGLYQLAVRAKAQGYQDSDLSATAPFTKLAAPVVTAADTTVTWNAVPNAASYDIYVDNELWENTTGEAPKGYKLTLSSISLNAGDTVSIHMNNLDGTTTVASTLSSGMSWENVVSFWITDSYDGNKNVTINGTVDGMYSEANPYVLTKDTTLIYDNICLTGDMMVTLADGSEKQICDLTSDDTYIAYDLATGDLVTAPAKYFDAVDGHSGNFAGHYQKYTFDDGTVIKEVHKHRFLNLTKMEFINLCHWEIGDRIYKIDGTTPALVSKEIVVGMVEHFTVTTEKYHDGFVQGCLYGDRYTQRYKIQMVDGKPVYDFSKPHTVDYLYGELEYDD